MFSDGVSPRLFIPSTSKAAARICALTVISKKSSHALKLTFGFVTTFVRFIKFLSWYIVACSLAEDIL